MHVLLGIIVHAHDEHDAETTASDIMDEKVDHIYDWFSTVKDIESRWGGECPDKVVLATSEEGRKFIDILMSRTETDLLDKIKDLRKELESKSDKQLLNEGFTCDIGSDLDFFLYDMDGNGVMTRKQLADAISNDAEEVEGTKTYVVPCDAHF